ncbi:MAG: Crp/Fnr family transcriptional regulator [Flavobacteriaceae bacterium]|nr:Crp/Fnr family transcriptional regulator [Flavobacteriaceae bacterium]
MKELLDQHFGYLFSDDLLDEIAKSGKLMNFSAGDEIIGYGQPFLYIPLLLTGAVKIMREDEHGNELLLYFLERGDTCATTLNSGFGKVQSEIRAEAETNTQIVLIPLEKLEVWICQYPEWRKFVLDSYQQRINELQEVVEVLAFQQLDQRLNNYLRDKAMVTGNTSLFVTHQEIARDLNSSRVVISRMLKKLENQGILKIGRSHIELLNF